MKLSQSHGNIVMMQLVIAGLKLQPSNSSFHNARDAIIFAVKVYYKGKHECLIWKGFAKRGLGSNAKDTVDEFAVPP